MDPIQLRKNILRKRDLISTTEQKMCSAMIMKKIIQMGQFTSATTLFTYVDFRSEVKTAQLMNFMLECNKNVLVPVTLVKEKDLLAVSITDPALELAPGYCSIPEPVTSIREKQAVSPETIDIIFLPGSVFDERGGRMGYGGGYYDRFVSTKAPQALRVGLAYEQQVVERAPLQDHDEFLDYIITEERIVVGNRRQY